MTLDQVNELLIRNQGTLYRAHDYAADLETLNLLLRLDRRLKKLWSVANRTATQATTLVQR